MNKNIFIFLVISVLLTTGCAKKEKAAIKIGDIEITAREFDSELKDSRYSLDAAGRKACLNQLIRKKLILHEAEKQGLDKNPQFLKDIQFYWEQGLVKLVLAKKTKDVMTNLQVSDQEINEYYQAHRQTDFAEAELPRVYDQIKWFLFQEKQNDALTRWVDALERQTPVQVDYGLLKIKK